MPTRRAQPGSHSWWAFEGRGNFEGRIASLLGPAIMRGDRIVVVTEEPTPQQWPTHLLDSGTVMLLGIADVYEPILDNDPEGQRELYAKAVAAAISDGYSGLTAVADNTSLVLTSNRVDVWLAWEQIADDLSTKQPLHAYCSFDKTQVPAISLATLGELHSTGSING